MITGQSYLHCVVPVPVWRVPLAAWPCQCGPEWSSTGLEITHYKSLNLVILKLLPTFFLPGIYRGIQSETVQITNSIRYIRDIEAAKKKS